MCFGLDSSVFKNSALSFFESSVLPVTSFGRLVVVSWSCSPDCSSGGGDCPRSGAMLIDVWWLLDRVPKSYGLLTFEVIALWDLIDLDVVFMLIEVESHSVKWPRVHHVMMNKTCDVTDIRSTKGPHLEVNNLPQVVMP